MRMERKLTKRKGRSERTDKKSLIRHFPIIKRKAQNIRVRNNNQMKKRKSQKSEGLYISKPLPKRLTS